MSRRNLRDLAGKRVVFLNWRDPAHPSAGGSELYCWEIASRWQAAGAAVTLLTSAVDGRPSRETVSGIRIHRGGGRLSLYPSVLRRLAVDHRMADIVVDVQNGIPFFSPLVLPRRTASVMVVHHVHQDQFGVHMSPWMSAVGRTLEGPVARRVYGRRPVVAVSPSTRSAVRLRLGMAGPVYVVPNGTPSIGSGQRVRSASVRVVAAGRLVAHKRFDLLVQAAGALCERHAGLKVDIVGDGPERASLSAMINALDLRDVVTLWGRVSERDKSERFAEAWVHVQPSQGEGWGITVLEAAAHGVPSVAFDVPGLCDSIQDGRTGWLLPESQTLCSGLDSAINALRDADVAERFALDCRQWANSFTWDDSADRLAGIALSELHRRHLGGPSPRHADTTCVARFERLDDAQRTILDQGLRPTDFIRTDPVTGRSSVILYGCDEQMAGRMLESLGISEWDSLGPAGTDDLLGAHAFQSRVDAAASAVSTS